MGETIRTFIAIELNEQVKRLIQQIQARLKPLGCDIGWVKPENVHLTLKFLGEIKTKLAPRITEAIESIAKNLPPVETTLTGIGFFPDARRPRVVWVGLNDTVGDIARLAQLLETALGDIGFKKENRGFKAHITIGRIRTQRNITVLTQEVPKISLPPGIRQSINQIILFKSTLTAQGPIYEPLSQIKLNNSGPA